MNEPPSSSNYVRCHKHAIAFGMSNTRLICESLPPTNSKAQSQKATLCKPEGLQTLSTDQQTWISSEAAL